MTTDITELAQKPTRYGTNSQGVFTNQTDGAYVSYLDFVALVEALEKAQAKNALVAGGIEALTKLHERIAELDAELEREREKSRRVMSRIAELESRTVTAAAADVLAERQRQMTAEGWTPEGDDRYTYAELSIAAQCYAAHSGDMGAGVPVQWPWDDEWWKPSDRRRNLIKAGALILAEIERLDRAAGIKWEAE